MLYCNNMSSSCVSSAPVKGSGVSVLLSWMHQLTAISASAVSVATTGHDSHRQFGQQPWGEQPTSDCMHSTALFYIRGIATAV